MILSYITTIYHLLYINVYNPTTQSLISNWTSTMIVTLHAHMPMYHFFIVTVRCWLLITRTTILGHIVITTTISIIAITSGSNSFTVRRDATRKLFFYYECVLSVVLRYSHTNSQWSVVNEWWLFSVFRTLCSQVHCEINKCISSSINNSCDCAALLFVVSGIISCNIL